MKVSDTAGLALFIAFGLWFVLMPKRVIVFYKWFLGNRFKSADIRPNALRVIGLVWITWLLIVVFFLKRTN